MLSYNQQIFVDVNRPTNFLLVGTPSLVYNGLMYGNVSGEMLTVYTDILELDGLHLGDVSLEYNHFNDSAYCIEFDKDNNLWLPTAERALVDTIHFLKQNYIEGPLIESLQNYLAKHEDLSELYAVAEHYSVSRDEIDYWINEALEEDDMSMG